MLNQCSFIGRLGQGVDQRYTQGGDAVCNFTIACGEKYKDKSGDMVETTEWVRVVAWRRLAEICAEYLDKGSLVYISGKMQTRQWEDKDGNKRYTTEIVAREMKMLDNKGSSGGGNHEQSAPTQHSADPDLVPF